MVAFRVLKTPYGATDEVRSALEERLPGYMIPSDIKVLARLPKSSNGKIDRARVARLFQSEEPAGGSEG